MCFQGNNVVDEIGSLAVFAEIGSSASLVSGARIVDAFALMSGHKGERSDAPKAYTQCPMLKGVERYTEQETWMPLERDQWPKEWGGITDLVRPPERALYCHLLAWPYWDKFYIDVVVNVCVFLQHLLGNACSTILNT